MSQDWYVALQLPFFKVKLKWKMTLNRSHPWSYGAPIKCVPVAVSSILSADRAGFQSDVRRWHLCKVPGEVAYLLQAESPERKPWPHPDRWTGGPTSQRWSHNWTGKWYAEIKWIIPIMEWEFVLEPNCKPVLVKTYLWIFLYFQDGTVTCPPSCSLSTSCHHHLKAATRDQESCRPDRPLTTLWSSLR